MNQIIEIISEVGEFLGEVAWLEPGILGIYAPIYLIGLAIGVVFSLYLVRRLASLPEVKVPRYLLIVALFIILFFSPVFFALNFLGLLGMLLENIVITGSLFIITLFLSMLYKNLRSKTTLSD